MENEKENKKNKVKKTILEAVYWCGLGLCLVWALICGATQSAQQKKLIDKLSTIEERLSNKEETRAYKPDSLYNRLNETTDLTGTTWVINSEPSLPAGYGAFSINFTTNNEDKVLLRIGEDIDEGEPASGWLVYENASYQSNPVYVGSWSNENYRTINITGGTDTTNNSLISWLLANATQSGGGEDTPEITGLTMSLNKRYDFRKWFGEVDPLTGVVNMTANMSNPQYYFDIGYVSVGGITYDHLAISFIRCTNAINIISGYDFQNQCYLAIGGGDYYNSATNHFVCLGVDLIVGDSYPTTNKLVMYSAPLVGARLQYETGNPISPTDYTPATGFLCSTYELKETAINWTNYLPSDTKYNFNGIGDNYSVYEVLQLDLLNDTYLDFYSVSASATGGNVFDLIGNAFKSLVPILGIQVIPGIPIGLLVVLPITATILIVVIKLVRK